MKSQVLYLVIVKKNTNPLTNSSVLFTLQDSYKNTDKVGNNK